MPQPLSWSGARWELVPADPERAAEIARATGLSPTAARCLASRWTGSGTPGRDWLEPHLGMLHDPFAMANMEAALDRLRRAMRDHQHIRIITDYDVDGTTSSLILQATLRLLAPDLQLDYHIPSRFDEGYGFSVTAASRAVSDGVGLIVTADIGVRDHEAVRTAVQGGVDVLICDHHLPAGADVPPDAIVLCPPQSGCDYPNPSLAACGVSLKLAQALLADHPKRDAVIRSLLKLAAIGTVADLVPLTTPENRAIVSLGLKELNAGRHNAGLAALIEVCKMDRAMDETDLGFRVGPRINAAGRLQDARMVVELLTSRDAERARPMAEELDRLNRERRDIQHRVFEEAMQSVDPAAPPAFVVVSGPEEAGWHRGVVGIVASKVKDVVHRPVAVVSVQGELAVGSVRSVDGVHAVRALDSASDLLVRYGGHPMAAGFTVPTERLGELAARLAAYVESTTAPEQLVPVRRVDATPAPDEVTGALFQELAALGPFGMGNPRPRLLLSGVVPFAARVVASGRLLKLLIPRTTGALEAIWWGGGEHLEAFQGRRVDLLGQLGESVWQGRRDLQLEISDVRDAG